MFKKLLILPLFFLMLTAIKAQELPLTISNDNAAKSSAKKVTFKETVESFEKYFATKDITKKGSGYKPFKRWEYHWSQYLQADGTIAPAEYLWDAWKQKKQMEKSAKVASNWVSKGPFSQSSNSGQGRVNTVFVDPNNASTIYVGAPAGGLWKSTNNGVNWTPLTDDIPQIGVSGIAIDPGNSQTIYISTGDDDAGDSFSVGVLKSTDGGATWSQTGSLSGNPNSSNEILIDPTNSSIIWVATKNGLFKSTNAGNTWVLKRAGNIKDFKLKPGDPNTIYAVSDDRFYVSSNGGNTFSVVVNGLPASNQIGRLAVEVTPAAPNKVYVLATTNSWAFLGIYISDNSGASFSKTNQNTNFFGSTQAWYDLAFSVSPTNENTMFVGVLDIWKSVNGGDNFVKINDWRSVNQSFTHADIHFLRYYNGNLYAGTDGGVYRSTNNGASFTDLTTNMSISQFYKVSVSRQNSGKLAGGLQDNGGFSLINNNWHNYHGGDGMDAASDPNDESTFYGFSQFGGGLTITTNNGVSSTFIANAPSQETGTNDSGGHWVTPLVANKASQLYAGYGQLYEFANGGWIQVSNHSFGGDLENIEIDPSNNDIIFVSRGLTLYKSTNRGKSFSTRAAFQTGITGTSISSIEVHNTNSNIIWVTTGGSNPQFPSSGQTGGGVFKSTDGGQTFTDITDNLPNESKLVIRHHMGSPNNSIYVGTALGVYYRDDATNTWEPFSTNLPNVAVTDLEINPFDATITAATYGRSVWQSSIPSFAFTDLDLTKVSAPNSENNVSCGSFAPSINVLNNGLNTITSFTVNYDVDGGSVQTFNWTGSLATNASTTVSLPNISAPSEGQHTLNFEVVAPNDINQFNNISSSTFTINQSGVGQFINTFENVNTDQWTADSLWEIGTPTSTSFNNIVTSGYVTNPSGNYTDNTVAYLYSPCYNLAQLENPVLKFKMAFDIEKDWDVLYMEYSLDGSTWQVLGTAADPNWYNSSFINPNRPLPIGKQWTGRDTVLKDYSFDLAAFTNETSIIFRFKFASDQNTNGEGVVIDDFVIDATAVLAVNEFEEGEFSIFPNPSSAIFNIKRTTTAGENMNIKVYDVTGKLIRQKNNIIDANYRLDMNGISKGIYFLQVSIDNKRLVKKLILN
ncbi:MAG TPA: T9SS type A sorting domain-containing protein [Flavobacteriia bacterium]|nr:T9SS type A sorting domain-containing protein [Flavobacteriia bacterium]